MIAVENLAYHIQKHLLGGCTTGMPLSNSHRRHRILFHHMIPCYCCMCG